MSLLKTIESLRPDLALDVDYEIAEGQVRALREGVSIPSQSEIKAAELGAAKNIAKLAVKDEANRRILAVMPEWKQRNQIARSVEIVSAIVEGSASQADIDELAALKSQKGVIDAERAKSDAAETAIDALDTVAKVEAYDVKGW